MSHTDATLLVVLGYGVALGYWLKRYFRVLFGRRQDARWQALLDQVHRQAENAPTKEVA